VIGWVIAPHPPDARLQNQTVVFSGWPPREPIDARFALIEIGIVQAARAAPKEI
jgi:hypothetical protein